LGQDQVSVLFSGKPLLDASYLLSSAAVGSAGLRHLAGTLAPTAPRLPLPWCRTARHIFHRSAPRQQVRAEVASPVPRLRNRTVEAFDSGCRRAQPTD
jgi:hypothetical protein